MQQRLRAVGARWEATTLHLFGGMTFDALVFEPPDLLPSAATEQVEVLEACAGLPINVAMVASPLDHRRLDPGIGRVQQPLLGCVPFMAC